MTTSPFSRMLEPQQHLPLAFTHATKSPRRDRSAAAYAAASAISPQITVSAPAATHGRLDGVHGLRAIVMSWIGALVVSSLPLRFLHDVEQREAETRIHHEQAARRLGPRGPPPPPPSVSS